MNMLIKKELKTAGFYNFLEILLEILFKFNLKNNTFVCIHFFIGRIILKIQCH